ncbi:MAG: COX15/CtaA family protein [Usitatibacter sp.]
MRPTPTSSRGIVAAWLLTCCGLVFLTVVIGGMTRLTHSGLSIVEWQPIVGAVPPLNDAQWQETFAKYRETPEFRLRNHDMDLAGFKPIFWWEYVHRLMGRIVGLAFLLPFVYFLARRMLDPELARRLASILILGGLQGALGWYMVKSGLVDDPRVSPLRLASHLGLAFLIYGLMLWEALTLLNPLRTMVSDAARRRAGLVVALVFVMVLSGALVAAIRAGFAYNTWPTMDGRWIPDEIMLLQPWWSNVVNNMATVQFMHRVTALVVLGMVLVTWARVRQEPPNDRARSWSRALVVMAFVQAVLGIGTLLLHVPLNLAALHQAGAVVLFSCAIGLRHALRPAPQLQL